MSARTAAWFAWSTWILSVVLVVLSGPLYWSISASEGIVLRALNTTFSVAQVVAFSAVGALLIARRPTNRIGWILAIAGLTIAATSFAGVYAEYSLVTSRGSLAGTVWAAWFVSWIWIVGAGPALTFLLLIFPDGRLPSRRWRLVGWFSAAAITTIALGMAFTPGPMEGFARANPLGFAPLQGTILHYGGIGWFMFLACVALSAVSVGARYRRANAGERQQIKWFAFAGAFAAIGWVGLSITYGGEGPLIVAIQLFQTISIVGVPVAVGIAVLRYRLYDIDLLINRTLVYGALTALLVAVYVGSIVVLQGLLGTLTGQESQLAIVASTLAVAALFNPLRRRIQSFIDRRFYRSKYDAAETLEAFSAKLRDETDLDALSDDLVGVVRETMQPAHVSLWLRPDSAAKKGEWSG
jgi:hypothetical protein